jgi:TatD DNase family protein
MIIHDAHLHLHDPRLNRHREKILNDLKRLPLGFAVVNGTNENDWEAVALLASEHDFIIPSFGLHPWNVACRSEDWKSNLLTRLETPRACIGEIGVDKWIPDADVQAQSEAFLYQFQIAAERNLPASIHCLKAWGLLLDLIQQGPIPQRGFLIHSYGGSEEMIEPFGKLGAYFSVSGYFFHERKQEQLNVFRTVPLERLLIETDAPDMLGPGKVQAEYLLDDEGHSLNHPANLLKIYEKTAAFLGMPVESLAAQVDENFRRFFEV